MWRRGADSDGYVANFVETEQIMHLNGFTASFVQVKCMPNCAYVIMLSILCLHGLLLFFIDESSVILKVAIRTEII